MSNNEKPIDQNSEPEKTADDFAWNDVIKAFAMFPTHVENVIRKIEHNQSAPIYHAYTITITVGDVPAPVLGLDRSRKRALLGASKVNVFVGDRSQLTGGRGFMLPVANSNEFRHTDDMYVALIDPALAAGTQADVYIYVEKELE